MLSHQTEAERARSSVQVPVPDAGAIAIADLVQANLPVVHHQVKAILGRLPRHVGADDLLAAGMMGLVQAASSFDPAHGVPFDRFAVTRVRGAIVDELRRLDWASRSVRRNAREVDAAAEALTARNHRRPTAGEIAAEIGVEAVHVRRVAEDVHQAALVRFDVVATHDGADSILPAALGGPEEALLGRERIGYLLDAVACLPDRLRHVIVEYFLRERPMQDIADELGVTESRVSQMRAEALELLRDGLNSQLEPELVAPEARPDGRVARRKAAYYAAVASRSDLRTRLEIGESAQRARVTRAV